MKTARLLLLWLALAPVAATAGQVGALVLDIDGEVAPGVTLFDEVAVGTVLTVAPGGRLMLEHYRTCETVTVGGGPVAVRRDGFGLDGADVLMRRDIECPEVVRLSDEMVTAGVILRAIGPAPVVGPAPTILLAGGAAGADRLRVERDGRAVATLHVRAGRVDWPAAGPFLEDGARYRLVLTGGAGERQVEVVAAADGPWRVILRPPGD